MMPEYRLLPLTVEESSTNMSVDEAILREVGKGRAPPTLRLYRWEPSAVSIGCFQGLRHEVDLDVASREGVDVVRRITGGGSVFHDHDGELTYSFVSPLDGIPEDIIESFRKICGGISEGLKSLGVDASYSEVNDILVGEKKISGSAQTRRHGAVLQHGTILMDPDVELMFRLLKVPPEKITDKFVSSVYQRVTSLTRELGSRPEFEELREAVARGFEKVFEMELSEGELSEEERELAGELEEKYGSEEWRGKR